jgi:predicted tellurium resistance membrane protein TerC
MTTNNGNVTVRSSGGIGFLGALALLFIALKLTGHITWSWWWVLAPIWIPFTLFFVVLGGLFLALGIDEYRKMRKTNKKC